MFPFTCSSPNSRSSNQGRNTTLIITQQSQGMVGAYCKKKTKNKNKKQKKTMHTSARVYVCLFQRSFHNS